ncbi:MAG: ROK family protein [Ruminococcaceae bacterium]|nr:ROK family protein [Oscillospiraceae bacterium]
MTRAINSESMKENNRKQILRLIMKGEYSRANIAKMTGLTKAAVSIITESFLQMNLVTEEPSTSFSVGRRPWILSLCENRYYAVGVNISRTSYEVGIHNLVGKVLISEKKPLPDCDPDLILEDIHDIILAQLKAQNIAHEDLLGIGVTAPGPIDYENGVILSPPNFERWHNYELTSKMGALFDNSFTIKLENVSNAVALYENYYGKQINSDNFMVVLADDTGIGAGIIVGNALYRGATGLGGEFGHISIDINGKQCSCGNKGCLERYAGIPEILKDTPYSTWEEAIDANDTGLIEKMAHYLSAALISAINLFDINTVILMGHIGYKADVLCHLLENKINDRTITKSSVSIVASDFNNLVGVAGSIMINDFLT